MRKNDPEWREKKRATDPEYREKYNAYMREYYAKKKAMSLEGKMANKNTVSFKELAGAMQ